MSDQHHVTSKELSTGDRVKVLDKTQFYIYDGAEDLIGKVGQISGEPKLVSESSYEKAYPVKFGRRKEWFIAACLRKVES